MISSINKKGLLKSLNKLNKS